MTPNIDPARRPSRFADEEEPEDDCAAELEAEQGDPEAAEYDPEAEAQAAEDLLELEARRPTERRQGGFTPLSGGVLTSLLGPQKRNGIVPPDKAAPVVCMKEGEDAPEAFVCLRCGDTCEYAANDPADPENKPRRLHLFRRPLCACERERARKGEEAEALRRHEDAEARKRTALATAARALKLPDRLSRSTFDNYDPDRHSAMKAAYMEARVFAEECARFFCWHKGTYKLLPPEVQAGRVVTPPQGLVFVGPTGRGKSHLTAAIGKYLAGYGVLCRFYNVEAMFTAMNREIGGAGSVGDILRAAQECDVLILDDLGTEHISANNPTRVRSTLYSLINHRYEKELPTVVSTMLTPADLAAMYGPQGAAIVSRLSVGTWLKLAGPDGRTYGRQAGPRLPAQEGGAE